VDSEHEALVRERPVGEPLPQLIDDPVAIGIAHAHLGRGVRGPATACPHIQKYQALPSPAQALPAREACSAVPPGASTCCSGKWHAARWPEQLAQPDPGVEE